MFDSSVLRDSLMIRSRAGILGTGVKTLGEGDRSSCIKRAGALSQDVVLLPTSVTELEGAIHQHGLDGVRPRDSG